MIKTLASMIMLAYCGIVNAMGQPPQDTTVFLFDTLHIASVTHQKMPLADQKRFHPVAPDSYVAQTLGTVEMPSGRHIQVANPLDDGVIKILTIGNSFSDDAVESYFHDLARQTGKAVLIGNIFRGGAPLDFHLKNATEDISIYTYRKTTIDGVKTNTNRLSIRHILNDENWDYISFQQSSVNSGLFSTYQAYLPDLYAWVKANYKYAPIAKFVFHQTWAYAQNATTKNFDTYHRDQALMMDSILYVTKHIGELLPDALLVPSGTAIHNARTSYVGDNLTREGYHLDLVLGRFVAASTWYEAVFGSVLSNSYRPFNLSEEEALLAKTAAHYAVAQPLKVSSLRAFQKQKNKLVNHSAVRVNFGSMMIIPGWNYLLHHQAGTAWKDLKDTDNASTYIGIALNQHFEGRLADGPARTATALPMFGEQSRTALNVVLTAANQRQPFVTFSGLDPQRSYNLRVFSSTMKAKEHAQAYLIVAHGKNNSTQQVNPTHNRSELALLSAVYPDKNGVINISFALAAGTASADVYLNAIEIR